MARAGAPDILKRWADAKDDDTGYYYVRSVQVFMACVSCIEAEQEMKCTHVIKPPWYDQRFDGMAAALGGPGIEAELKNVGTDGIVNAFPPKKVAEAFSADPIDLDYNLPFFVSAVDPGGGSSNTAVVTMVYMWKTVRGVTRNYFLVSFSLSTIDTTVDSGIFPSGSGRARR